MDERPTPEEPSPFDIFDDAAAFDYGEEATRAPEGPAVPPAVRRENLRQREHFASTGEFILHNGPKVRVVGKTLLIHKDGKPHGVNLQLARQVHQKGYIPEWGVQPATIYINGDETEELYARLAEARLNVAELGSRTTSGSSAPSTSSGSRRLHATSPPTASSTSCSGQWMASWTSSS